MLFGYRVLFGVALLGATLLCCVMRSAALGTARCVET